MITLIHLKETGSDIRGKRLPSPFYPSLLKRVACLCSIASIMVPHIAKAQLDSGVTEGQRIQTEELVLQMPDTWSRLDDTNSILTLVAPLPSAGESFRDNIRVKKYPLRGGADLDRIHAAQEKSAGEAFQVLGSGILSTGDPRILWLAITKKQPDPGQPLLAKIDYLMINQGYLFVLHAMCETSVLNERRPMFDAIARSVNFTRSSAPTQTTAQQQTTTPQQNGPGNSPAFEEGRKVGHYFSYAMLAVVGVWLVFRLAKFARR